METATYFLLGIFGLAFGSLGSVLLYRLDDDINGDIIKSIFLGRSRCPNCKNTLKIRNLIPVFSYIFQDGKCTFCKNNIGIKYLVLEILSMLIFVGTWYWGQKIGLENGINIFWIFINWIFSLLIIYDFDRFQLHIPIWIVGLLLEIIFIFFVGIKNINIWIAFFLPIMFLAIYYFSKFYLKIKYKANQEGFGIGDVLISISLGLLGGFVFLYNGLISSPINIVYFLLFFVIISGFIGMIFSLINKIFGKEYKIIPFVPAMIIAFWILLLFGDFIFLIIQLNV